jgi:hypothetical protein
VEKWLWFSPSLEEWVMGKKATHNTDPDRTRSAYAQDKVLPLSQSEVVPDLEALREAYCLSHATVVRMLGLSKADLALWEKGELPADLVGLTRLERLKRLLKRAAEVMRPEYVPIWVEKASPACAEIGAQAPIDLMEKGDYDAVEDLLFLLGSGVPY